MTEITNLPTSVSDGQTGHLNSHQVIHAALKNHEGKVEDAVSASSLAVDESNNAIDRVTALEAMSGLSPESPVDGQTANLILQEDSLTRASVVDTATEVSRNEKLMVNIDPADFGAVPLNDFSGAGADSTDALLAALEHARTIRDPAGRAVSKRITINAVYKFNRDIVIPDIQGLEIVGEGRGSGLIGINAGIIIGGEDTALISGATLRNLRIQRVTLSGSSHGTALLIAGSSANSGKFPVRWALDHVEISSPIHPSGIDPEKSVALKLQGTFLATCTALYLRSSHTGLVIDMDDTSATLAANAVTFLGGEIQGVRHIGSINGGIGIAFFGMAWEGASQGGMDVNRTEGLTVAGFYWEANANYDLRLGNVSRVAGVSVNGGVASVGAFGGTDHLQTKRAITVTRAQGVDISGIHFMSYGISPVLVDRAEGSRVTGGSSNCSHSNLGIPVEEFVAADSWNGELTRTREVDLTFWATALLAINGRDGARTGHFLQTNGSNRWEVGTSAISETGDNVGSNYSITAYGDTGSYLGEAIGINRSSQRVAVRKELRAEGSLTHTGSQVGFYGRTPVDKPSVTGSKADGAAWESVLSALVSLGLVTDNTTP